MKKIIFCGFGELGKVCIQRLISEGYHISYVFTHRENKAHSVDTFTSENDINYTYIDARKNLTEALKIIDESKADFLVSVNYRYIIPKEIYTKLKYAFNVHGSLLPKYRGRTPHVWSIINGEKVAGVTAHIIEESVDTGDIILQKEVTIENDDTGYTLLKKFEQNYPCIVIDAIRKLSTGKKLIKQDNKLASYYGKRIPEMGYIDFRKNADEVINFVRAQAEPYPGAYYYLIDGRKIIINKVVVSDLNEIDLKIGVILEKDNFYYVRCKDHTLLVKDYRIID